MNNLFSGRIKYHSHLLSDELYHILSDFLGLYSFWVYFQQQFLFLFVEYQNMLVQSEVELSLSPLFFVFLNLAPEIFVLQNIYQRYHAAHSRVFMCKFDELLKFVVKWHLFASECDEIDVFFLQKRVKNWFYLWLFLQFAPELIYVFVSLGGIEYFAVSSVIFQNVISQKLSHFRLLL